VKGKRRNHLPGFKAKVALAAIKGDKALAELAEQFDVGGDKWTAEGGADLEAVVPRGQSART